jgi:hypothetical protein
MAVYIGENTLKPLSPVNTMSSITNAQNLLKNVFRPTFFYDTTNNVYHSKLELINIDTISANFVSAYSLSVSDSNSNVYVGSNAGNVYSNLNGNSNNTFVGFQAGYGSSNVINNVFLGFLSGIGTVGSSKSVSLGGNSLAGGISNIYIGYGTGITAGNSNIFIGTNINSTTNNAIAAFSNTVLIKGTGTNYMISGSNGYVGINMPYSAPLPTLPLMVNGFAQIGAPNNGMLGINITPASYHLDVSGYIHASDGAGTLLFSNGTFSCTNGMFGTNLPTTPPTTPFFVNGNAQIGTSGSGSRFGINMVPSYGLDVTGTMRVNDGTGSLSFSNGALSSTGGFFSSNGTLANNQTVTVNLNTGTYIITARNQNNTYYQTIFGLKIPENTPNTIYEYHRTATLIDIGFTSFTVGLANIGAISWSVTFFPSP